MRKLSPELAHALAAEYVVGTLRGRARRRFEAIVAKDHSVADIVRRWEGELTPLAQQVGAVEPPARVWKAIEARIAPRESHPGVFWKGFGLLAGGLATVLVAAFLWLSIAPRSEAEFVAVLTAPDAVPRMVVSMHAPDQLRVRMVKPWKGTEGKGLELWAVPKDGKPRSLGMIPNAMGDTLIRVTASDPRVQGANAFAVSLEPPTGSPTQEPTGPVLCSGGIAAVRRT
jgi:anti-sigma-K factor RskA